MGLQKHAAGQPTTWSTFCDQYQEFIADRKIALIVKGIFLNAKRSWLLLCARTVRWPTPRTCYTPKSHFRTFFQAQIFSKSAECSIGQLDMGAAGKGGTKKCVHFKWGISAVHAHEL